MPNSVTVGYEGLQQAAQQLRSGRQELDATLQELQALVGDLTSSGFKTRVASTRFGQHYRQWTDATAKLVASLDDIARAVQDARQKHEQADSALAEGVGALGATAAGAGGVAKAVSGSRRGGSSGNAGGGGGSNPGNAGGGGNSGGGGGGGGGGGARGANSGEPNDGTLAKPRAGWEKRPLLNGQERARPVRDPSPDRRAAGDPERLPGRRQKQNRDDIDRQNKNGDVLEQQGYGVRHQPKDHPGPHVANPHASTTADYKIGDRYFEHKIPHTPNVRSFVDNNLEKGATRWLREGKQAERFVVDLSNGPFTADQLRAELVRRVTSGQGTGVQEVFVVHNGHVLYLFP